MYRGSGYIKRIVHRGGALLFFAAACLLAYCLFAAGSSQSIVRADDGTVSLGEKPSEEEIERAIAQLSSYDLDRVSWIQNAISQQVPERQSQLRKSLDAKINNFFKFKNNSFEAVSSQTESAATQPQESPSPEELKNKIDSLNLGPKATVEDIRQRDELLALIVNIADPDIRYELLQYLEKKENTGSTK